MEELAAFTSGLGEYKFPLISFLFQIFILIALIAAVLTLFYDRYIQRHNQLLINYPLIGRLRYLFYLLRDPMRQYFGDEKFYESFDKVKWVYNAAEGKGTLTSFSPGQPQNTTRISIKNANTVFNKEEIADDFDVLFGRACKKPFVAHSVIGRSAMSDGAISPEGTRAFTKGAFLGNFPINTGEGGLTSNFLYTHGYDPQDNCYLETQEGTLFAKTVYKVIKLLSNRVIAEKVYRHLILPPNLEDTYLFDEDRMTCYRVNWDAPLEAFPQEIPEDIPDIIFQIGSGLYGVRDKNGDFDEERYRKTMCFCGMTEIKIAQGAKQTGGKLLAN